MRGKILCFVSYAHSPLLPALIVLVGCSLAHTQGQYSVNLKNNTSSRIDHATVSFSDKSWSFTFGILDPGIDAEFMNPDGMPNLPDSLIVEWKDSNGEDLQVKAMIDKELRDKANTRRGRLEIAINGEDDVSIEYRERAVK